ncbi:membrane hypothetical protein [Candidatus Terasakiella magnetica]|uniref:Glycosyltransferase RgtA/B/C/D-like domain-containing protein n=1 Tax=Candidatus Terasakiella magnetica TaxID=1867952 RepID=A0A1C3RF12_9PROT|nr:hypothetical protein [Candidatus Terasakiella magnetica]SCA55845.1 membrane hypothetical protein [Candidatus Terasakiella magnetica]
MLKARLSKIALFAHMLVPLAFIAISVLLLNPQNLLVEDSQTFLDFSANHSLGYPVFLKLIQLFSADNHVISYVQIALFSLALVHISIGIFKITTNHLFGILSVVLLCTNPFTLDIHYKLSPDSLFLSLSLLMIGFIISAYRYANFLNLLGFGLSLGLCMVIQPYGLAYLPLILFVAPMVTLKNHCSLAKAFLLPALACLALTISEATMYKALHEGQDFRPATQHIYGNALLMETTQSSPYATQDPRTGIWEKIETDLRPVRTEIWGLETHEERSALLLKQLDQLKDSFAINAMTQASFLLDKSVDDIRMDIASSRIIQAPLAYFRIMIEHYRSIWKEPYGLSYVILIISALTVLMGLWMWITRTAFNGPFALSFCSAFGLQSHIFLLAHTGVGHAGPLVFLSPLIILMVIGLFFSFYISFINPLRTNG